ncbi:MAG: hypothetical protein NTV43_15945 [Methylococcales bacterium]|nr:hypothetical protein [Methylococcales bacterium]
MSKLVQCLARFNRKERFWLLSNALDEHSTCLGVKFRKDIENVTGIHDVPANAWWAMDYHLDWLVGALHLYNGGKENEKLVNDKKLIIGNHQDIDFVVAFGNTLILIEAKGDTSWTNKQLREKVGRLIQIGEHGYFELVQLKYILMSPNESAKLSLSKGDWPDWMKKKDASQQPMWIQLTMGYPDIENSGDNESARKNFVKVVRVNEDGKPYIKGHCWSILDAKLPHKAGLKRFECD